MLATQENDIIIAKQSLQDQLDECFDQNNEVLESHYIRYEELRRTYEFLNGQQSLIGSQVKLFKLNKNTYYDLVNDKYMDHLRNKQYKIA